MAINNDRTTDSFGTSSCSHGRDPSSMQGAARSILLQAVKSVLPESILRRFVSLDETTNVLRVARKDYNLNHLKKLFIVGGGKAAKRTGAELVRILGNRITAGILNVYLDQAREPISERIKLFAADHPIPNAEGVKGARRIVELLKSADAETLVIALISGGGSSLMALPVERVSLEEYQATISLLLAVPAAIDQINAVRKHIDPLKGGGMRKLARRAGGFVSLVMSDVPVTATGIADDASVIASGLTVGDDSTFGMAKKVLSQYNIWDTIPLSVKRYIEANVGKEDHETLPKDSFLLAEDKSQYVMIANNDQAMEAAKEEAERLGYKVNLIGWGTGTVEEKIRAEVTYEIENIWKIINPCLSDRDNVTFASFSTDGIDGNSDIAGAIADRNTLALAKNMGLDYRSYLEHYDSATFFKTLGLAIISGPTGTNVADITLVLITSPNYPYRKIAFIFGGEAMVKVQLSNGQKPGYGGRNSHLVILAAEKLARIKKPCGRSPSCP
jgi:glycerate 2-kinase